MGFSTASGNNTIVGNVNAIPNQSVASTGQQTNAAAASRTDTYTVGAGKYWILHSACVGRDQAGFISATVNGRMIFYFVGVVGSVNNFFVPLGGYRLAATESIVFTFSSGTSGSLISSIMYTEYSV